MQELVRPERFELPTCCSGGNRSIQLSYGRTGQLQSTWASDGLQLEEAWRSECGNVDAPLAFARQPKAAVSTPVISQPCGVDARRL